MNSILRVTFLCAGAALANVAHAQTASPAKPASPNQLGPVALTNGVDPTKTTDASQGGAVISDTSGPAEQGSGDIIVTARRRDEKLQDVPASVAVLTSQKLEATGARMVLDFAKLTPGVTMQVGATEPGDASINIRGLNGARDAENNVALVIDGVLRTSAVATTQPTAAILAT